MLGCEKVRKCQVVKKTPKLNSIKEQIGIGNKVTLWTPPVLHSKKREEIIIAWCYSPSYVYSYRTFSSSHVLKGAETYSWVGSPPLQYTSIISKIKPHLLGVEKGRTQLNDSFHRLSYKRIETV